MCILSNFCFKLNSNIRCIEILDKIADEYDYCRWIVTLDVLKFRQNSLVCKSIRLNSNIRCIEIYDYKSNVLFNTSWIVTLDVLKFLFLLFDIFYQLSWIVTLDVLK